jgi:hypothetical protein
MGNLHESLGKKVFCVKKVTKLPDLTVWYERFDLDTVVRCEWSTFNTAVRYEQFDL